MSKYILSLRKNNQELIDLCGALLVFFLPISTAFPNLLLLPFVLMFVFSIKEYIIVKKPYLIILFLTLMVIIVESLIKNSFIQDININSRYLQLLVIFILFTQIKDKYKIELFFISGTFIAVIFSFFAIINHTLNNPDFLLDSGSLVNEILWLERPYFGFVLSVCVFMCFKNAEKTNKVKMWFILLGLIFIFFSVFISARLSIILNLFLTFYFLLRSEYIKQKIKIISAIAFLLILIITLTFNANLASRMRITDNLQLTLHLIKEYEPRFVTWPCSLEIVKNNSIFLKGFDGRQKMEDRLIECYNEKNIENKEKQKYYSLEKFNTHNQFFDFLLIGGVLPFILLLSVFIFGWVSKNNSSELKVLLFLFFAFFFVENVLQRQLGVFLFGIFLSIYSLDNDKKLLIKNKLFCNKAIQD